MLRILALFALAVYLSTAQTIDATKLGTSIPLQGDWKFHAGDDPQWANPSFDDSTWRISNTNKNWDQQGLKGVRGYFWFRIHVLLPPHHPPLSLLVNEFGPYELYVDGTRLGGFGRFPPDLLVSRNLPRVYPVQNGGDSALIAFRLWVDPRISHFQSFANTAVLGARTAIEEQRSGIIKSKIISDIEAYVILLLNVLLGCGVLVLYFVQRDHSEYLFLSLLLISSALNNFFGLWQEVAPMSIVTGSYLSDLAWMAAVIALIEFVFRFLRQPMPIWFRVYQLSVPFLVLATAAFWWGWMSSVVLNTSLFLYLVPCWFATPGLLIWRYARGNREAGLLAIPTLLTVLDDVLGTLGWVLWELHLRTSSAPLLSPIYIGIVPVHPGSIFSLLFLVSVAALILYRFQRTRTEQARATAELEAARTMQEVMVPRSVSAAGFHIESAYIPAQEVGGDFFQLFPAADGSLLVVIGDVSGKGVKAAMLVSLILGLLRRILKDTREPAKIITELNEFLAGQTDGRFATCCCALLHKDGRLLIANAGHLSPYCDGLELDVPGGLPLGLAASMQYEQVSLQLPAGKRLVFLSDGVVEARSKSGELYGFDRTRTISIEPVHEIAQTAQRFGQEDDITVLGIERQPALG